MRQTLVALTTLILVVVALACGGGSSSGSVTYAPTVVSINHIDFTGVELTAAEFVKPPAQFVDLYPPVVATANGETISGESLARSEIGIELARRSEVSIDTQVYDLATPREFRAINAIDDAIESELARLAITRLGLLPTHDEAVAYTQAQEQAMLHPSGPIAKQRDVDEALRQMGYPASNWASDPTLVENFGLAEGFARLRKEVCSKEPTPTPNIKGFLNLFSSGGHCGAFLARERKNAKIVYYVRWAD